MHHVLGKKVKDSGDGRSPYEQLPPSEKIPPILLSEYPDYPLSNWPTAYCILKRRYDEKSSDFFQWVSTVDVCYRYLRRGEAAGVYLRTVCEPFLEYTLSRESPWYSVSKDAKRVGSNGLLFPDGNMNKALFHNYVIALRDMWTRPRIWVEWQNLMKKCPSLPPAVAHFYSALTQKESGPNSIYSRNGQADTFMYLADDSNPMLSHFLKPPLSVLSPERFCDEPPGKSHIRSNHIWHHCMYKRRGGRVGKLPDLFVGWEGSSYQKVFGNPRCNTIPLKNFYDQVTEQWKIRVALEKQHKKKFKHVWGLRNIGTLDLLDDPRFAHVAL